MRKLPLNSFLDGVAHQNFASLLAEEIIIHVEAPSNFTPEYFEALCAQIGDLPLQPPIWSTAEGTRAVLRLTNHAINLKGQPGLASRGPIGWHTEGIFADNAENVLALYCRKPARWGGHTRVIDSRAAYDSLPESFKSEIADIEIVFEKTPHLLKTAKIYDINAFEMAELRKLSSRKNMATGEGLTMPDIMVRPLVLAHPLNARKAFYYPFQIPHRLRWKGNQKPISKNLEQALRDQIQKKKYLYRHRWKSGDLLFIDLTHSLHRRDRFFGFRDLYRCLMWYRKAASGRASSSALTPQTQSQKPG